MIDEKYRSGRLRNLSLEEMEFELEAFRREMFSLRYQLSTGQLERTSQISMLRKAIARASCILRERQVATEAETKSEVEGLMSEQRASRKVRVGVVVSNKMDKTCVVQVERRLPHPVYKKVLRRRKKYQVHDEQGTCNVGDVVKIMETRPLSKHKRWRYVETIRANEGVQE